MFLLNKVYTGSTLPAITYPGQLWFDESVNKLKIYDGSTFQSLDYFDHNIEIPQDTDIATLTSPISLQQNQRAYLNFSSNTVDLTKIQILSGGYQSYRIDLTIFTETSFYSLDLNHGFGSTRINTTLLTAAATVDQLFYDGGTVAYRGQSDISFTRSSKNADKFSISPVSHGMFGPISGTIYIMYRGYNDKRSLHFDIRGQGNFLLGSQQALSNGNPWNNIGTFQINTGDVCSGYILITRIV